MFVNIKQGHNYKDLSEVLIARAKETPNKTFMVFGHKEISFFDTYQQALKLSSYLKKHGLKKGDRVCLWMHNAPEFVIAYFAVLMAGATVVPVNSMFKREEAKYVVANCGASVLICSAEKLEDASNIHLRVDGLELLMSFRFDRVVFSNVHDFYKSIGDAGNILEEDVLVKNTLDDIAEIIYTSGTTGKPKGACLSHGNILTNISDCANLFKLSSRDAFICLLPMFHSFSLTVTVLLPLLVGAKVVIFRAITPFKRVIRSIRKNKITIFVGVPALYNLLKEKKVPWLVKNILMPIFNPLRICVSGSAALPAETIVGFEKSFRVPLLEGYGLTEASPVVSMNPLNGKRVPGSVGLPLPSIRVKVVDEHGKEKTIGEIGELLVDGPNVMKGYFKMKEETSKTIKNGWLHTGDLAKIDSKGFIYIVGRSKDMINVRGFNVYPREIEETLYGLSCIKEVAVVGVKHPKKGEVPVVFVVIKDDNDFKPKEINDYLKEKLASYKLPYRIVEKETLPKNTTGKILKYQLKEEFEQISFK